MRAALARWIQENGIVSHCGPDACAVLNEGLRRGKASAEDRYVVYELGPAGSDG